MKPWLKAVNDTVNKHRSVKNPRIKKKVYSCSQLILPYFRRREVGKDFWKSIGSTNGGVIFDVKLLATLLEKWRLCT